MGYLRSLFQLLWWGDTDCLHRLFLLQWLWALISKVGDVFTNNDLVRLSGENEYAFFYLLFWLMGFPRCRKLHTVLKLFLEIIRGIRMDRNLL